MATLRELVAKAHAAGIKVIHDQVANHVGIQHPWFANPPLDNWFHPGQPGPQLRADILLSPNTPDAARQFLLNRWFTQRLPDLNQEAMHQWTADWNRLRRERPALRRGSHLDLSWDEESYLFARRTGDDLVLIAINRSDSPRELKAPAAWLGMGQAAFRPLIGGPVRVQIVGGEISIQMPPQAIVPFEVRPR